MTRHPAPSVGRDRESVDLRKTSLQRKVNAMLTAEALELGPLTWTTHGTLTGQGPCIYGEENYFDDGSPRLIAELETTRHRDNSTKRWKRKDNAAEIEAIATLFCAAPALLKALQGLVKAVDNDGGTVSELADAVEAADAAIAAAIGR